MANYIDLNQFTLKLEKYIQTTKMYMFLFLLKCYYVCTLMKSFVMCYNVNYSTTSIP